MRRCSNGNCQNSVRGKWKQCLACRLERRVFSMRYKEKVKKRLADRPKQKQVGWTQERWEAFVRAGGLEGL